MPPALSRVARALYRSLYPLAYLLDKQPALRVGLLLSSSSFPSTNGPLSLLLPPPHSEPSRASLLSALTLLRTSFRAGLGEDLAIRSLFVLNTAIANARRNYHFDSVEKSGTEMITDSRHFIVPEPTAGSFLIAAPSLDGAFERALILILEHSSRGTFGVVLRSDGSNSNNIRTTTNEATNKLIPAAAEREREHHTISKSTQPLLSWSAPIGLATKAALSIGLHPHSLDIVPHLHTSLPRRQRITGSDSAALRYFKKAATQARLSEAEIILGKLHSVGVPALDGPRSILLMTMAGGTLAHSLLPLGPGLDTPAPRSVIAEQDQWDARAWRSSNSAGGVRLPSNVMLTDADSGKNSGSGGGGGGSADRRYLVKRRSAVHQSKAVHINQRRAAHNKSGRRTLIHSHPAQSIFGERRFLSSYKRAFFHVRSSAEARWLRRLENYEAFNALTVGGARPSDYLDSDDDDNDTDQEEEEEGSGLNSRQISRSSDEDDDEDSNEDDDEMNHFTGSNASTGRDQTSSVTHESTDENFDSEERVRRRRRRGGPPSRITNKSANILRGIVSRRDLQSLRNAVSTGGDLTPRMMEAVNAVAEAVFSSTAGTNTSNRDAGDNVHVNASATLEPPSEIGHTSQKSTLTPLVHIFSSRKLAGSSNEFDGKVESTSTSLHRRVDPQEEVEEEQEEVKDDEKNGNGLFLENLLRESDDEEMGGSDDFSREKRVLSLVERSALRRGSRSFLTKSFIASLSYDGEGALFAPLPHKAGEGDGALAFLPLPPNSLHSRPSIIFLGSAVKMRVDQSRVAAAAFVDAINTVAAMSSSSPVSSITSTVPPPRRSGGPVDGFSIALHSIPGLARAARRRGATVITLPCASTTPVFVTKCDLRSLSGARGAGQRALTFNSSAIWSAGQLQDEILQGSWIVTSAHDLWGEITHASSTSSNNAWSSALHSLGGEYSAILAAVPSRRALE